MEEYIEAALELHKPLLVLDRPNPTVLYRRPVLEKNSAPLLPRTGAHRVWHDHRRICFYGDGEKWLSPKANEVYDYYRHAKNSADTPFHFLVIKCLGYDHKSKVHIAGKALAQSSQYPSIYLLPFHLLF